MTLRQRVGHWVEDTPFQRFVTVLIVLNGITLGLETSDTIMAFAGDALLTFDAAVLAVFVFEISAKLAYRGAGFFRSGWNVFDFCIVGIALMPASGPLAVLRALRILRVLRLVSVVPALRRVVGALLHAVPGLLSVMAIILLLFYVGSVLATKLFGDAFELWFGSIGASMYTLFQIMTLESWSMGIVRPVMEVYPYAWLFFVPFIIITSFAVLNLFIGIIVDAMNTIHDDEVREEAELSGVPTNPHNAELVEILQEVKALRAEVKTLSSGAPSTSKP
ncbi:MAG: ion transporter [Rhodospirillaceae bacterium]